MPSRIFSMMEGLEESVPAAAPAHRKKLSEEEGNAAEQTEISKPIQGSSQQGLHTSTCLRSSLIACIA